MVLVRNNTVLNREMLPTCLLLKKFAALFNQLFYKGVHPIFLYMCHRPIRQQHQATNKQKGKHYSHQNQVQWVELADITFIIRMASNT